MCILCSLWPVSCSTFRRTLMISLYRSLARCVRGVFLMSELTGTTKINYSWRELKQLEVKYFTIYSSLFINGFSFPFLFVCAWNLTLLHICILLFSYFLWQAAKWNEMTIIPFEMANGPHHNANVMNARHKCKFHKDINAIRILYVGQLFRKRKIIYISTTGTVHASVFIE